MADYALALSDVEVARYRLMAQVAARSEREQWAAAGLATGAHVADVGCGPGAMSLVLADLVGPTGRLHGVDRDGAALQTARRSAREAGLTCVSFSEGLATATGLPSAAFDVVMLRHVLAHNGGSEQAIVDHLATLVRPGGSVYLVDIEATAVRLHPVGRAPVVAELAERYALFHAQLGNDLSVGLRLGEMLETAGLEAVEHRGHYSVVRPQPGMRPPAWAAREQMLAAGVIDDGDIARYEADLARLDRGDLSFTMFMPTFTAWARRPLT